MSLGMFGASLIGVLVVLCLDRSSRLRTVVTGVVGVMLGLVIAGSDGAFVGPAHHLVDGVRAGLATLATHVAAAVAG